MTVYDFAFILDADPHDESVEERFFEPKFSDTTLILQNGALVLAFDREAPSYKDAVLSAYRDIRSAKTDILGFDPDYLVTAAEIARRANLSPAAISKYTRPDTENGFPQPVRSVMSKRPCYDWVKVSKWFLDRGEVDLATYQQALVSRVVNVVAQTEATMHRRVDMPKMLERVLAAQ